MSESPRVLVVDHGAGNLVSISQGLAQAGAEVIVSEDPGDMEAADGVVLPGVGAMASVMDGIRAAGFEEPLRHVEVPLLGICVGMQVLFDRSEEDDAAGLGLFPGRVERLRPTSPGARLRLPHIGWNNLEITRPDPLLDRLPRQPTFYFVHSYAPVPEDDSVVIATTTYGRAFCAAVRSGPIAGVQFHPERSGQNGLALLASFVDQIRRRSVVSGDAVTSPTGQGR